jgi:hypothetical protein
MTELNRIADQKIMDDWTTVVNHVMSNVAYEQTITVTDGAASAAPMPFSGIVSPVLAAADFSSVKFTAAGKKEEGNNGGNGEGAGGKDKTVKVQVDVTLKNTPEATRIASQRQYSYITGGD